MANRNFPPAPPMPQMVQMPIARQPSVAELADVAAVRALQIRTNALQFAIAALDKQAVRPTELTALAAELAAFLELGDISGHAERYDIS